MGRVLVNDSLITDSGQKKTVKKLSNKKRFAASLLYVFFIGYCLYQLFVIQQPYLNELNRENKALTRGIAEQTAIGQELQDKFQNANSQETIENLAREKLGFVKPNEKLFIDSSEN